MTTKKRLACDAIEATTATQVRIKLHKDVIEMYQEDLQNGAVMPPVDVFAEKGSSRHILADGFHRLLAHINAGKTEIDAIVHEGGMHEALAFALQANRLHGLRRSNADKINAVRLALKDPVFSGLTQQEIADLCGVSRATVNRTSVRQTTGREDEPDEPKKPRKPTEEDHRPTKKPPTQEELDVEAIREACAYIKGLPYPGDQVVNLPLTKTDVKSLEYVSAWTAHAFVAARGKFDE